MKRYVVPWVDFHDLCLQLDWDTFFTCGCMYRYIDRHTNKAHMLDIASFPGLLCFFCSLVVLIHGCGRAAKNGEVPRFLPPFRIRVLLSMQTEEQNKTG